MGWGEGGLGLRRKDLGEGKLRNDGMSGFASLVADTGESTEKTKCGSLGGARTL